MNPAGLHDLFREYEEAMDRPPDIRPGKILGGAYEAVKKMPAIRRGF